MKSLAAAIALFYFASTMAAAPYGIKGQKQAATLYSNVHQFPNNQVTNMGGIDALVETGNNNILSNPSFEHLTTSSSWVDDGTELGIGTAVAVVNGKKALAYLPTAETINLTQSSTLYAAQFADGVQGIATVRVKSSVALKVCSIQAGTVSTSNCVNVSTDNKWGLYKVPFILGATSNGISIASSGNVSGTVYIDDAFVGAVDLKQDVNNIGPWTSYTPTWTVVSGTNPSIGNGSISGKWRQVGESIEVVFSINSGTTTTYGSGVYVVSLPSGLTIDSTKALDDYGTANIYNNVGGFQTYIGKVISNTSTSMRFIGTGVSLWTNVVPVTLAAATAGHSFTANFSVPVTQFSNATSVYSTPMLTNADRIGEVIQTTNSTAPQGFISAMNKSIGQTGSGATFTGQTYYALYEHLWSIAGLTTTAGDVYRISSAKGASASADFAANKTITIDYETNAPFIRGKASAAGVGAYSTDTFASHSHRFPWSTNNTGTTLAMNQVYNRVVTPSGYDGATEVTGSTETKPKNVSLNIFIRYAGDTQLITGQFNGLESCTDSYECTDTYSFNANPTGTVLTENIEWITGNATKNATGDYTFNFKSGLFTLVPACTFASGALSATIGSTMSILGISTTSVRVLISNDTGAEVDSTINIICQKQGADYIGKTAMAVASDQNVRSVGSTGVDIQSVYFGGNATCTTACTTGNCTICNQVGSKITSVSWLAIGAYNLNGIDGKKYNCSITGYNAGWFAGVHDRNSSTSSAATLSIGTNANASANVGYASSTCIGIP